MEFLSFLFVFSSIFDTIDHGLGGSFKYRIFGRYYVSLIDQEFIWESGKRASFMLRLFFFFRSPCCLLYCDGQGQE